ncbi:MAG TPA: hypothetical protein PKV67_17025 [Hyphomonas sp.]|nr:hypothetical protein [Hyphomonas sp.]HRJ02451.1 hypothetical protein [Hyphomonas sp.]HRK68273.1 hypothetical protein [Hyphomonas sp.]
MAYPHKDTPDLSRIASPAIRWIAERAVEGGNDAVSIAQWTKALVVHMRRGLTPELKAEVAARYPQLHYYCDPGSPHSEPDEGYLEEKSAISFPRPRAGAR